MDEHGQATQTPQKPPTGRDARKMLRRTIDVFRSCEESTELDNGYALAYPSTPAWRTRLAEVAAHWRRGMPLFEVQLTVDEPAERIVLTLTGPPEAKEHVERMLEHSQSDVLTKHVWRRLSLTGRALAKADVVYRRATASLRVLPDFFIIGAAKCGTSSLYGHLTKHPSIASALRKELYFFDHNHQRGLCYYRSHFPTKSERRRIEREQPTGFRTGEATPCYLFHPHVPRRIASAVPDARLIVILRNPVSRAYSDYCMKLRRGFEELTFEEAIDREPERIESELEKMLKDETYFSYNRWHFSYLARGHYAEQLERWYEHFSTEQILVLASEDFFQTPTLAYAQVMNHLGLPEWEPERTMKSNFLPYPEMSAETRARLVDYFAPHNQRLYELVDREFDWDK